MPNNEGYPIYRHQISTNIFGSKSFLDISSNPTNPNPSTYINPNVITQASLGRYNVFASNPQYVASHMPKFSTNINLFSALSQPTNPNFAKLVKKPIPQVQNTAIGGYR